MIEFYPQIKLLHIVTVIASGALFLLRGAVVQTGRQWAMAAPLRYLSYGIDTVLLTAALLLLAIVPSPVYANGWLLTKVGLLVVYIGLGSLALKRGRTASVRGICFIAAIVTFGSMLAIARTHHPLGPILIVEGWLS